MNDDLRHDYETTANELNDTMGRMLHPDDVVNRIHRLHDSVRRGGGDDDHDYDVISGSRDDVDDALTSLRDLLRGLVGGC